MDPYTEARVGRFSPILGLNPKRVPRSSIMNTAENPIQEALKTLENGVANLIASEGWENYLKTQARFHNYSFNNALWLMIQGHLRAVDVTKFAGFQTWKKLGRFVRKGELSFKVLAPCTYKREVAKEDGSVEQKFGISGFRVVSVFDVSQTDGEPLPAIVQRLEGQDEQVMLTFARLAAWSCGNGIPVIQKSLGGINGVYSRVESLITVDDKLSDVQALKTLVHEIAHSLLHSTDEGDSRSTKEIEAESTAFVVLHALGINAQDYSFGYVASWSKGSKEAVRAVAGRVQKTAHTILEVIETFNDLGTGTLHE